MANNSGDNNKSAMVRRTPEELGLPAGVVDVTVARAALNTASTKGYNLLGPQVEIAAVPVDHHLVVRVCEFPTQGLGGSETSNGVWYKTDGGKFALHGAALAMLAAAAGIQVIESRAELVEAYVWRAQAIGKIKSFDGQWRRVIGSKEVDLRDGSPGWEVLAAGSDKAKADRAIRQARIHGAQNAESKAQNRMIRKALGLRGGYTLEEANKPFVFVALQWRPDMTDPETRRMVAATELGIVSEVFGSKAPVTLAPIGDDFDRDEPSDERPADMTPKADPATGARRIAETIDVPVGPTKQADPVPAQKPTEAPAQQPAAVAGDVCEACGKVVTDNIAQFSISAYGKLLCYEHQKIEKARIKAGGQ